MKKVFLFGFVCCLIVQANAQTFNNTIVNDNSSWAVLGQVVCPECPIFTEYIYFDSDSIIGDISYKKVFLCNDKLHENISYEGLMREQDKKIYFIPANSETEYLLYDFSLEEGMSFDYTDPLFGSVSPSYYVKKVDSVEINGMQLKQIQLAVPDYGNVRATWIEKIGSLTGLFYPCGILATGVKRELLCYFQNEGLIYKNPAYSDCYYDNNDSVIPLLTEGNQWNELAENQSIPPEYQYQRTYITKTGNDTLINGVNYYKLFTAKDESASIWMENGCIREDVENRKVYYKPDNEPEILLYDFSAQVGDKIQSYDLQYKTNVEITVEFIDYFFIGGKLRKQMNVRSTALDVNCICFEDHVWIEGIGNTDGFLQSTTAVHLDGGEQITLQCFFQNEELVYKPENTGSEDCFVWRYLFPNKMQSIKNDNISIYPNPADDVLTVSCLNNTLQRIEIVDISGKKVYSQIYKKDAIDVRSFSKGLYLLKTYNANGQVSLFKFVKN